MNPKDVTEGILYICEMNSEIDNCFCLSIY